MAAFHEDPKSVHGKTLHVAEHTQLLVVGAGPAGLAAAVQAARLGLQVVLVDENPVPVAAMGDDIPLQFGQRIGGVARNRNAMLEAFVASDPAITEAFDAGVDVRLGTAVWGIYGNGPSVGWLPGPVAGLADGERSWMLGCERMIVAAGRRDMGLAFPGWELPGVLGITAAQRLLERYGALDVRRAVVLGSTAEALAAAAALRAQGVTIAAVVEAAGAPVGPSGMVQALAEDGVELLCGQIVQRAEGGGDGVAAAWVGPPGSAGRRIDCDAILLGVAAIPVVELLDALACRITFVPERGGHVPIIDAAQRTSVDAVYAVGDCAGIWAAKTLDAGIARAEGIRAANAVAAALGMTTDAADAPPPPEAASYDLGAYRLDWVRASVIEAGGEPFVCQCEEVTAREILEVRPPRYLDWPDDRRNRRDLLTLLGEGAPNPDQVKRLTRAGMGLCQGRRCREQVAALLALGAGTTLGEIPLASHRAPVRPIPLSLAADPDEPAEMTEHWDTWFGMKPQYVPFWDAPRHYTVASRDIDDTPVEGK